MAVVSVSLFLPKVVFSGLNVGHSSLKNNSRTPNLNLIPSNRKLSTGLTLRQYQRLESGERNILTSSFGLACRVIEALDMDVSKFYHGDYYLEEELKTTRGKGFRSRKKLSI